VTWTCFFAPVTLSRRASSVPAASDFRAPLLFLGTFAPSLVAIALSAWGEGISGTQVLLRRLVDSQAGVRWYLFAISYMAAIKVPVAVIDRLVTGSWPPFGKDPWYAILVAIIISTPVQAGEEVGWRGYALPRLASRLGLARASVLLGLIWACWHIPLFFRPGTDKYGQPLIPFVLGGIALSVAMAWLYANVNGSLLLMMLMHSAVNQTIGIVPSAVAHAANPFALNGSLVAWLTDVLLWMTAAYFLVRMRHLELSGSVGPRTATIRRTRPAS
jgi:membrane protease YdiL (CAAX protease family)